MTAQTSSPTPTVPRRWLAFSAALAAMLMELLDATVSSNAGPAIRANLGGSYADLQWIGAGYTLASGTSASAVAAACMRAGLVGDHVTILMPGGDLAIRREKSGHLVQSGPARRVYRATVDLADFGRE